MANATMNDFLLQYYMQRRFNTMPPEHFARFQDYIKNNDDFRGNMKSWKKKLMHQDGDKWVENEVPDPTNPTDEFYLNDDEWKKLFFAFQNAFRSMAAGRKSFKDNSDANDFLDEWFGHKDVKLFSIGEANDVTDAQIENLYKILGDQNAQTAIRKFAGPILSEAKTTLADFRSGLKTKKYNTDIKFRKTLQQVASALEWPLQSEPTLSKYATADFSNIIDDKKFEDQNIPTSKLDDFKRNYRSLLNTLEGKKKIFDVFKNYDDEKISGPLDKARENLDYDNASSKDYLPPKRDDELTPWQQVKKWTGETYEDYMEKYIKLRGDRLYFSPEAKNIVKAISGCKIKPTDGLGKVMDSMGDIEKNLKLKTGQSNRAMEHLEWFKNTLSELKATMPKAFEGALSNGRQMRAIIEELILKAVQEGKEKEAKTAMEVLSVIKYGYTTSKIMDAFNSTEFSIFSDGSLSWNKNEGMQFVTKAFDKSVKTALMGVGYGITIVGNAVQLSGSKFNGAMRDRTGRLRGRWQEADDAGRAEAIARRNRDNPSDELTRDAFQAELNALDTGADPINADTIEGKEADLKVLRKTAKDKQDALDTAQKGYDDARKLYETRKQAYDKGKAFLDNFDQMGRDKTALEAQNVTLTREIGALTARINDPRTYLDPTGAPLPAHQATALAQRLNNELDQKQAQHDQNVSEIARLGNEINAINYPTQGGRSHRVDDFRANFATWKTTKLDPSQTAYTNAHNALNAAKSDLTTANQNAEDLGTKVSKYKTASGEVKELTERIEKRNKTVTDWDKNHQDQYKNLMDYWDFLETGRNTHTGNAYSWGWGSASAKVKALQKQVTFNGEKMTEAQKRFLEWQQKNRP